MVKIGFIVEGDTEKLIIESDIFLDFLSRHNRQIVKNGVINATGNGNLLPRYLKAYTESLREKGAEEIYILTDSDGEPLEEINRRIGEGDFTQIFIAIQAIESWFMADFEGMQKYIPKIDFSHVECPESYPNPFEYLKQLGAELNNRGTGTKIQFAKKMINHWKFSVESAAKHPNGNSVKYFVQHFINEN